MLVHENERRWRVFEDRVRTLQTQAAAADEGARRPSP
jgi:hypothetical protein